MSSAKPTLNQADVELLKKTFTTKSDLKQTEKNIKGYIHEGVDAVVNGVDNLFSEYQVDSRIKKLEKIHPKGKHIFEN